MPQNARPTKEKWAQRLFEFAGSRDLGLLAFVFPSNEEPNFYNNINDNNNNNNNNNNSNWAKWNTVQGVIVQVISRSDKREAQGDLKLLPQLLPELYDVRSNY